MFKRFISGLALTALTLIGGTAYAAAPAGFAACPQFFAKGVPIVKRNLGQLRELCFSGFAVLHSGETKTPVVVVERLNRASLMAGMTLKRKDKFYEEARLPRAERGQLSDYENQPFRSADGREVTRYDRGHMAPAKDASTEDALAQSFSLANIIPQPAKNNRGPWVDIEKSVRKYILRAPGMVTVITGPVFNGPYGRLGSTGIPTHLFKLVYDETTNRAWAYWLPNTSDAQVSSPITYEELTRRIGDELLPGARPKA